MKKLTKALITTGGIVAATGLVVDSLVLTRVSRAVRDKMDESKNKKNPPDPTLPANILREEGLNWLESKDYDHIVIKNRSNQPIHAMVVKASEPSDKWVVCVHGYTSEPKRMGSYALHYYNRGYNVILPVMRGHNVSEQPIISMGWLDRLDVVDWIQYLLATYGRNIQIVLHGVSMGAATVMMTTGEYLPFNIKCCIADCGYTSAWDQFENELKKTYHLPPFPILYSASLMNKVLDGFTFHEASTIKQLKKSKTPTLFIHGEKDAFVPYRMLDANFNAAVCPKEKLSIPDAEHAESHFVHPEIYWPHVFDFIDKYVK